MPSVSIFGGNPLARQHVVFRETFTGDGSDVTFQLTSAVGNATFDKGSWAAANILNTYPADVTTTSNGILYDSANIFTRHRITVSSISSGGLVTLDYAPRAAAQFYIYYWYNLAETDYLENYWRGDYVASMEGEAASTVVWLYDTDYSNVLTLTWNEADTGDRVLNFLVHGADRTIDLTGNLIVESASILNQDLTTDASPTFVTAKLSGLSDGYLPYHVADATGLANSFIRQTANTVVIDPAGMYSSTPDTALDLFVYGWNTIGTEGIALFQNYYVNTTNGTTGVPILTISRQGETGVSYSSEVAFAVARAYAGDSGGNSRLDIILTAGNYVPTVTVMSLLYTGGVGIGTTTVPHSGVGTAQVAIDGSTPHIQFTVIGSDYPTQAIYNFSTISAHHVYACYYESGWKSSDTNGNFIWQLEAGQLVFYGSAGTAVGSSIGSWNNTLSLTASGTVQLAKGTGTVQIGTSGSIPAYLALYDSASYGGLARFYVSSGATDHATYDYWDIHPVSEDLTFEAAGNVRVTFKAEGGIGIGTATIPHGGVGYAKLAIEGADSTPATGPNVQFTTASDDYPLLTFLVYAHNNTSIAFDAYYSAEGWRSSTATSFSIYKSSAFLQIRADHNGTAGQLCEGNLTNEALWVSFPTYHNYPQVGVFNLVFGTYSGDNELAQIISADSDTICMTMGGSYKGTGGWIASDTSAFGVWKYQDALRFRYAGSQTPGGALTLADAMAISTSGYVGIRVLAPVANLEVEDDGTAASMLVKITQDNGDVKGLVIGNDTYSTTDLNGLQLSVLNDGTAVINSTFQMILNYGITASIGIATSDPRARLEIWDGGTSKTVVVSIATDNEDIWALHIGNRTYSTDIPHGWYFDVFNDGTCRMNASGIAGAFLHARSYINTFQFYPQNVSGLGIGIGRVPTHYFDIYEGTPANYSQLQLHVQAGVTTKQFIAAFVNKNTEGVYIYHAGSDGTSYGYAANTVVIAADYFSGGAYRYLGFASVNTGMLLLDGNNHIVTIGVGAAGVDYQLKFDGETNDGIIQWMEDEAYFVFNTGASATALAAFGDTSTNFLYLSRTAAAGKLRIDGIVPGVGGATVLINTNSVAGNVGIGYNNETPYARLDVRESLSTLDSYGGVVFIGNSYDTSANPTVAYPVLVVSRLGLGGSHYNSALFIGIDQWEDTSNCARSEAVFSLAHGSTAYADISMLTLRSDGKVTIGDGSAGIDFVLAFNGETNDGALTWMEDEARLSLDKAFSVGGASTFYGRLHALDNGVSGDSVVVFESDDENTYPLVLRNRTITTTHGIQLYQQNSGYCWVYCRTDATTYQPFYLYSSELISKGNVTIGVGAAGVDYTLTFDGETNDGIITWMEDENYFKFSDDIMMLGGENIVLDTTTGTKIGTATSQLLGFYNATPVDQPAAVADATGAGDVVAQLNALLSRIRETGLIAT